MSDNNKSSKKTIHRLHSETVDAAHHLLDLYANNKKGQKITNAKENTPAEEIFKIRKGCIGLRLELDRIDPEIQQEYMRNVDQMIFKIYAD